MAYLTADYYVSVENGDDGNTGLSEAQAWATIDKAASDVVAGVTGPKVIAIAPGTYRETVVADNAGTAGNEIKFVGDPECLYFDSEKPGRVRITGCDANEVPSWAGTSITSAQDYVEWHKLWIDGSAKGIDFAVNHDDTRRIYDSVVYASTGIEQGSAVRCYSFSYYSAFAMVHAINCIGIGYGNASFVTCVADNCLAIGGGLYGGFHHSNDATSLSRNCIAVSCRYGFRDPLGAGKITNCLAIMCGAAGFEIEAGEATDCYFLGGGVGDADFGSAAGYMTIPDISALEGLFPWLALNQAGSLLRQGDNTGPAFGATDVDIGGHRLRLKGDAVDIGPWSVGEPTDYPYAAAGPGLLDWTVGAYHTDPPGVRFDAVGDREIKVSGFTAAAIPISCWVMYTDVAGDKPQLVVEGDSFATQTATATVGNNVWELLSLTVTPAVEEELTIMFRVRQLGGVCYYSDLAVGGVVLGGNTVALTLHDAAADPVPGVICIVRNSAEAARLASGLTDENGVCEFQLDDGDYKVRYGPAGSFTFSNPYSLTVAGATAETFTCAAATITVGGLTFGELQSNLSLMLDRIWKSETRHITGPLMAQWINAGYHELDRKLRWTRGSDSFNTTAETAAYDLDATVREILAVEYTDAASSLTKLKELSVEEYVEKRIASDTSGTPTHFVHHGGQMLLYPKPDTTAETVKIWAVTEPGDLTVAGDKPTFPPHLHEFILDLALAYAARHFGDLEIAQGYRANVAGAIEYEKKQPAADRGGPDRMIPSKF